MRSYGELATYSGENALPLDQVFREELQRLLLRYLSEHGFFVHAVFRGGTSIRLVYGGARFSEDLDFVLRPDTTIANLNLTALLKDLPSFLRREVPFAEHFSVTEQKAGPTFARYRCRIELQAPVGGLVINLEVAGIPSRSARPHVLRSDMVDVAIVVEDESEILVDKLVALALRSYVKGRDIWDTWFLTHERHGTMPEVAPVIAKAADNQTAREELITKAQNSAAAIRTGGVQTLDAEMKRFLPARLYDAMAPVFPDINAEVASMMDSLLEQLTEAS